MPKEFGINKNYVIKSLLVSLFAKLKIYRLIILADEKDKCNSSV